MHVVHSWALSCGAPRIPSMHVSTSRIHSMHVKHTGPLPCMWGTSDPPMDVGHWAPSHACGVLPLPAGEAGWGHRAPTAGPRYSGRPAPRRRRLPPPGTSRPARDRRAQRAAARIEAGPMEHAFHAALHRIDRPADSSKSPAAAVLQRVQLAVEVDHHDAGAGHLSKAVFISPGSSWPWCTRRSGLAHALGSGAFQGSQPQVVAQQDAEALVAVGERLVAAGAATALVPGDQRLAQVDRPCASIAGPILARDALAFSQQAAAEPPPCNSGRTANMPK